MTPGSYLSGAEKRRHLSSSAPIQRKLDVLGGGALGQLYAHELALAGHDVRLLVRKPTAKRARLRIDYAQEDRSSESEVELGASTADGPPIDCLISTAKAFDIPGALETMKPRLHADSSIVLVHNGLLTQSAHELVPSINPQNLWSQVTLNAAYVRSKVPDGHTVLGGAGPTQMGPFDRDSEGQPLSDNATYLRDALVNCKPLLIEALDFKNFYLARRIKLGISAPYNPLTSLMNVTNGECSTPEAWKRVATMINTELAAVLEAERVALNLGDPEPALTCEAMVAANIAGMQLTSKSFSTTLMDVRQGRRTELAYITGSIIELGKRYGVPTPCNELALQLVELRQALGVESLKF